eukprot:5084769-Prymnesium_polylepis.1
MLICSPSTPFSPEFCRVRWSMSALNMPCKSAGVIASRKASGSIAAEQHGQSSGEGSSAPQPTADGTARHAIAHAHGEVEASVALSVGSDEGLRVTAHDDRGRRTLALQARLELLLLHGRPGGRRDGRPQRPRSRDPATSHHPDGRWPMLSPKA